MARQSFIASGGPLRTNTAGHRVYSSGPIRGLTVEQAFAKFSSTWATCSPQVRISWVKKARASGMTASGLSDTDAVAAIKKTEADRIAATRATMDRMRIRDALENIERNTR